MDKFTQEAGSLIVDRLILAIQENKQYLSDIDGAIASVPLSKPRSRSR